MKTEDRRNEKEDYSKERSSPNLWKLRRACMQNAIQLIKEAELLLSHDYYQRAFTLGYTALEEVGKFIIVSDFIADVCSKKELEQAFYKHDVKFGYFFSNLAVDFSKSIRASDATIVYKSEHAKDHFAVRNHSVYIEYKKPDYEPVVPSDKVDKELAETVINRVKEEIRFIDFAEDLNGRIGSRAFYK